MEKKLTKELLLQYAQHSNRDVREAYQDRIYAELLKGDKGLVTIDDIAFGENFSKYTFYKKLTQKAQATLGLMSKSWEIYFKLISHYKQDCNFVAWDVIGLIKTLPFRLKKLCYNWLEQQPLEAFSGLVVGELLEYPLDYKLYEIALKHCPYLKGEYYDIANYLKEYPIDKINYLLNIVEALPNMEESRSAEDFSELLLSNLHILPENKKLAKKRIEDILLKIFSNSQNGACSNVVSELLRTACREKKINTNCCLSLIGLSMNYIKMRNQPFLEEQLQDLYKLTQNNNKSFASVYAILAKAMSLSNGSGSEIEMANLSQIFQVNKKNKTFLKNFLPKYKKLYLQHISMVDDASPVTFYRLFSFWSEMDKKVLIETIRHAPSRCYESILGHIRSKTPEFWSEAFDILDLQKFSNYALATNLITQLNNEVYAHLADVTLESLKKILDYYNDFDYETATILSKRLKSNPLTASLTVKCKDLTVQQVKSLLKIIKE